MKSTSPLRRFSLLCVVALFLFGTTIASIVTAALEKNMLTRAQQFTAQFVAASLREHFTPDDFAGVRRGRDWELFRQKFRHFAFGTTFVRTKFWNRNYEVIWADEPRLVGELGTSQKEIHAAFAGKVQSAISHLEGKEHRFEQGKRRLLELYVPVSVREPGRCDIVCEVYQDLEPLYRDLASEKRIVWGSTAVGSSLLYLVMFGIYWRASRKIDRQSKRITCSEDNYLNLVQSARDGIMSIDATGTVVFCNEAAAEIFGYSTEEFTGTELATLLPEYSGQPHQEAIARLFSNHPSAPPDSRLELEGVKRNGTAFPLELSLSSARSCANTFVTAIVRDVTLRKTAQEQLIKVERAEAISVIAAGIGHELNNCVTGLKGYAGLLRDDPTNREMASACAEVFSSSCERLQLFGKNLLSVGDPGKFQPKAIQLPQLLDRVAELLTLSGLLRRHTLEKSYAPTSPLVMGDEMQLEQVIMNLAINAVHAMTDRGTLTLGTRLGKEDGMLEFSVTDTGHGISPQVQERMFVPFFTTKEKGKGTGLGLYIVKEIVASHGGRLGIRSEEGCGTTVTVGLPVTAVGG